jgi:hypothetical protein
MGGHGWAHVILWMGMGGHRWAHVMLWVGMGGHRSMMMVMVWVWVQIRRKMLGSGVHPKKWLIIKVVAPKRCSDWPDSRCFTPLAFTFGCHWVNRFVCICIQSRMFWETLLHKLEGWTYLSLWENVTNSLQAIKSIMQQLAFLLVSSTRSLKNIAQIVSHSFWPNRLISTVFYVSTLQRKILSIFKHNSCHFLHSPQWSGRFLDTIDRVLVFASPTGYMLTSSSFPLLNWGIFLYKFL